MILPSSTAFLYTNEISEVSDWNQTDEDFAQRNKKKDFELIAEELETASENFSDVPVKIVWRNVILLSLLHIFCVYGLYLMFMSAKLQTSIFATILGNVAGLGVTAGAHRLWCHRSYKAKLPLRIFLAFLFTVSLQNDIYEWCRDHRVHHKYSETDADPHNSKRGFFFSHIGWLICRKHPDVMKKGASVDCSDLLEDPVVRFVQKYYVTLVLLCSVIFPTVVPVYFWNETFANSLIIVFLSRLCIGYNMAWLVNSAAHMWGYRPYDVTIHPRENVLVTLGALGEGFHNYHHTFPYDYATGEYGMTYNPTKMFIDLMAFFGLAYDRKTASKSCIEARKLRTGMDSMKTIEDKENASIKDK